MTQYLAHYGVKGMKWGKRKARPSNQSSEQLESANSAYEKYKNLSDQRIEKERAERESETTQKHRIDTRKNAYYNRAKSYVSHAINRLKKGDIKTAIAHGKSAVNNFLKGILADVVVGTPQNRQAYFEGVPNGKPKYKHAGRFTKYASGDTSLEIKK